MMKQVHLSLRLIVLATLILAGAKSAQAWDDLHITVDGVKYILYISGSGSTAVADSACVDLDNDKNLSGVLNIPSHITYEYHWKEYDDENNLIPHTSYLTAPVTRIEDGDFYNGVHGAFNECDYITQVIIPNTVKHIGVNAFRKCRRLMSVSLGNSVTTIGDNAFSGCTCISGDLVIPNSVIRIGACAFSNLGLKSVSIGNSVRFIGWSAFDHCNNLQRVDITDLEAWCQINFGMDSNPLQTAHHLYLNGEPLTDLTFPNTIDTIHNYAFMNCEDLLNVIIPDSVTTIGTLSFRGCSNLINVTIGNSVTTIDSGAFSHCGMKSLTIGKSVVSIGSDFPRSFEFLYNLKELVWNAKHYEGDFSKSFSCLDELQKVTIGDEVEIIPPSFVSSTEITEVRIPSSVTFIGEKAFTSCGSLESISVAQGNPQYDSRYDCNAIIETSTNNLILGCKNSVIPSSVTSIGNYAFLGCIGLTSVTIPNSVTSIGREAFSFNGLTNVTIPSSVTSMGSSVFSYCTKLSSITIENSVIGIDEFYDCDGLTNVTIPNSVTVIGRGAFAWCSGLRSVSIGNSVTLIDEFAFYNCWHLTDLTIGKSVTSIGKSAFEDCADLTRVTIPNSVTAIGRLAFASCSGLTSVTISNSVTLIDEFAFSHCWHLTDLTIGKSVTSIGNGAFLDAGRDSNDINITCLATTPPETKSAFSNSIYDKATLRVPKKSIYAYKSTSQWSNFSNIVGIEGDILPSDTNGDGEVTIADVNEVIDIILSGGFSSVHDVNGDGEISIADINIIINFILNQ